MHLIALEQQPTSQRGGQELNLLEICQGLTQRGHRVSLLYEREGNLLDRYREFCEHTIKINSYGFDRRRIGDVLNFVPSLAKIGAIPAGPDSVVFSNVYHTAFWGYLLSLYHRLPFVCYLQVPPFDFNRQRLLGLKGVDRFIAVSNQTKLNWTRFIHQPEKIDVVLNGTNIEKFKPANFAEMQSQWQIPPDTRVITFAGRLDRDKGLEILIKAFAKVVKAGAKAKLLIAGKPLLHVSTESNRECPEERSKYQQSLQDLASDLGISQQIQFLGHISNTVSLYQASDLTVVPSLWPEPFGRTIIEAMACGTPVIASNTGGIPEILTDEFQSNLVEPGDVIQLAQRIEQILDWRTTDPELGNRCRNHVAQQFSLENMVNGIEQVLLDVVSTSKQQPIAV